MNTEKFDNNLQIVAKAMITDYEVAKKNLFVKLVNACTNREKLRNAVYMPIADLALTCHLLLGDGHEGVVSAVVNYDMLKGWNKTENEVIEDALNTSKKLFPVRIRTMDSIMEEMSDEPIPSETAPFPLYVITNDRCLNGAAALFYPNVMDECAEILDGGYCILPSSVHEFIILSDRDVHDYSDLAEMVWQINRAQVAPNDQLADTVYHYDPKAKLFEDVIVYKHRRLEAMRTGKVGELV